jgi:colicin import membrane protein
MAFVMYTAQVQQRVKDSWIVTHERAGLTAVVQFGIRPNGEITEITLARSSGNVAFDQSALRAVHHANPLPPPPLDHLHEFLSQKVQVAFGE